MLELQIIDLLWSRGGASIRQIHDTLQERRSAYTTIQTRLYRLEKKGAVRRSGKIGNAHTFEPILPLDVAVYGLLDEIMSICRGHSKAVMMQLARFGKLTRHDLTELESAINALEQEKTELS